MRKILLSMMGQEVKVAKNQSESLDVHGNPVPGFSDEKPVTVYAIEPVVATESTSAGQEYTKLSTWNIYAPIDADISAFDEVTLPTGEITEVIGDPKRWDNTPLLNFLDVSGIHALVREKK